MVFRLGTIPIRVRSSFFMTMLFFGATSGLRSPVLIAVGVAAAFFSVLLHEMGHAGVCRSFGLSPAIDLHGMGGTTSWVRTKAIGHGQHILISVAGPAVGIAVGLLLLLTTASSDREFADALARVPLRDLFSFLGRESGRAVAAGELGRAAILNLVWVNAGWGVLNLIPMLPLDGGNIMASTLNKITGDRGDRPAYAVSIAVAALSALFAFKAGLFFAAIMAVVFGVRSFQGLAQSGNQSHDEPLRRAFEKAAGDINGGYAHAAVEALRPIIASAKTPQLRAEAMRALAYACEKASRWDELLGLLEGPLGAMLPDQELAYFENSAQASGRDDSLQRVRAVRARAVAAQTGPSERF